MRRGILGYRVTTRPSWFHRRSTIQAKIILAFVVTSLITALLGGYAVIGIGRAGDLVVETFDRSLMSINYARAAAADFAEMQAAQARLANTADIAATQAIEARLDELSTSLSEDLQIAAERAQSVRATRAVDDVTAAVAAWQRARAASRGQSTTTQTARDLDHAANAVRHHVDLLINFVAGDGFAYRQRARAAVELDRGLNAAGTLVAVLLSAYVTWVLAQHINKPLAAASAAASGIARGDLDTPIPAGRADELGELLAAMSIMRDNIRLMMEQEATQHDIAQRLLVDALQKAHDGVILVDRHGRVIVANLQANDFFRESSDLLNAGTEFTHFVASVSKQTLDATGSSLASAALQAQLAGRLPTAGEAQLADGRWLLISRSETQHGGFVAICTDITSLKQREAEVQRTNVWLDAALSNMSQGISLYDASNRLRVFNAKFCEIYRLPRNRVESGLEFRDVLELSVEASNHDGSSVAELLEQETRYIRDGKQSCHFQELSNGRVVAVAHEPLRDGGWVRTYEDVTERRRAELQLLHVARHDSVTGLANRAYFGDRVDHAVAQLGRNRHFAVLLLDMDHFKAVNDTYGHLVGDKLLRAVADRLSSCARETDTVARLGGDEFAVLLEGVDGPERVAEFAHRAVLCVGAPYDLDGQRVTIGASAGLAVAPSDGVTRDALLRNADLALYRAKADGRGTFRHYSPGMDARVRARRALELDLRDALQTSSFEVFYQPLVRLADDQITGFEALVRWRHPTRGMVSPAEFIPVAEETGLIVQLGEWVMKRACLDASSWPDDIKIAVNVSPAQFKCPRLVEVISEALSQSKLSPTRLEIEITESVILEDKKRYLQTLHAVRELGVRISMDDFGTGYSSLSHLRSFPFDKIKIDQSFVRDLAVDGEANAIIRAIVGLGGSLGMTTTAEGVETQAQLDCLRLEGCTEVQGYLFSMPRPAADVPGLIHRGARPALQANAAALCA